MRREPAALQDLERLFEAAPCGYAAADAEGLLVRVNTTFEAYCGRDREELLGLVRFVDLLSAPARIAYETRMAPVLRLQGSAGEVALDLKRPDGTRLPVTANAVLDVDEDGAPIGTRTMLFDATERRRHDEELARARRREQAVAATLQHSLLAGALPTSRAFELGVRYQPGVAGLEVGGDWYDAFWVAPGETVALVVGDVVGRGLEAAAAMGQLRSAVRALAGTGLMPGELLTALDGYVVRHDVGHAATLAYAELDLRDRELRYACAGHPPPVVLAADGGSRLHWQGRSWPLAASPQRPRHRPSGSVVLPEGATVLLYTDGLVERRGSGLDDGFARLLGAVGAHHGAPVGRLVTELLRELPDREHADDVCLLAARLLPAD